MSDLTESWWERFGSLAIGDLPAEVSTVAKQCVLDWFGCTLAGSREPLAGLLRDEFAGADGPCSVVGTDERADPYRAALINGATGHALDFDDTSFVMGGHATVPLLPAILAIAEPEGRPGADVITAYVVGMEIQSRIGASIGGEHYATGWHTTSTMGVFGAAAASCWLMGLDAAQFGTAMGIAASNASGVKANFGTMTKPLHPGQAAERGLMAARLAARGFTANSAAVDGNQSLAQAAGTGSLDQDKLAEWDDRWATPQTLFKYHAACHLTHAAIEATGSILADGVDRSAIEQINLTVSPTILDVCNIPEPVTGLEAKFSLRGTQALLVNGVDTAAIATFEDGPINSPAVRSFIPKVLVGADDSVAHMASRVEVVTATQSYEASYHAGRPDTDLERQGTKLRQKFDALAEPIIGAAEAATLAERIEGLEAVTDVRDVLAVA